jgi:hypothetical protein
MHSWQKAVTIKISIHRWTGKHSVICTSRRILAVKRNEVPTDVTAWMNLENTLSERI